MKRFMLTLMLVLVACAVSAENVRIMADRVEVRSYSSPEAPVVGALAKGTVLPVVSREGDWIRIKIPESGYPGYVPVIFCQFVQAGQVGTPPPQPQQPTYAPAPAPTYAPQPPPQQYAPAYVNPKPSSDVPAAEISAGYSFIYDDSFKDYDLSGSFPIGWMVSANFNVTPAIGVVLDVSGNYKSDDVTDGFDIASVSSSIYGFHGGFRFSARSGVTPYIQALAGVSRGSVSVIGIGVSATNFSIQPGVGLLFKLSKSVGVDVGGDYRLIFADGGSVNEFRLHAGVAFFVGSK